MAPEVIIRSRRKRTDGEGSETQLDAAAPQSQADASTAAPHADAGARSRPSVPPRRIAIDRRPSPPPVATMPPEGGVAAPIATGDTDVVDALLGLGYSLADAQTALRSLPSDRALDLEERIRLALQSFARR